MFERIEFRVRGIAPLLMHNGQLADPLNPFAKKLREFTLKKTKTDKDHLLIGHAEFLGCLYVGEDGRPGIPGENIEAAVCQAAKKFKLGQQAKSGILSEGFWTLEYDGPRDAESLWLDKRFVDRRGVRVQGSRVMRTRPMFRKWELSFAVEFLPDELNEKQVIDIVNRLGRMGIGDHKPKYGRFEVI